VSIKRKEHGFTIIEVVLVLAIAGLIFMMVFIALPALQRSQRDTQRKNDLSRTQTAITSYTSSTRGALPSTPAAWNAFVTAYLLVNGDTFVDPLGSTAAQGSSVTSYVLTQSVISPLTETFENGQNIIYYSPGYVCGTTSDSIVAKGSRSVAFRMVLEGGGYDCRSN
jgi:prepilin-type N-terminal cleavage/methylation domain-containing protein